MFVLTFIQEEATVPCNECATLFHLFTEYTIVYNYFLSFLVVVVFILFCFLFLSIHYIFLGQHFFNLASWKFIFSHSQPRCPGLASDIDKAVGVLELSCTHTDSGTEAWLVFVDHSWNLFGLFQKPNFSSPEMWCYLIFNVSVVTICDFLMEIESADIIWAMNISAPGIWLNLGL